ncbi:hypothetical protein P170DRAFT_512592 [Aspergillus steynii IBT 23096]|uniref:Uncharacterized protein n=1 Tax=Aspergillus steynii IBT 23096 TaxID=1392250 RepID=A0A2I2FZD6_9EURO|nr:uncharacterized protein P170DRAFT_512592 [Aspergillus steynii IBT 23096]PLB45993.1 hypothetical protein P170DRAFT_512592 [Aspergillus steynii IBT 23096]
MTPPNPLTIPITPSEIAYTSPLYTPPDGSPPTRSKRTNRSSRDSPPVLEPDGFIEEDLRAGGPFLTDLPVEFIPMSNYHPFMLSRGLYGAELHHCIANICRRGMGSVGVLEIEYYERRSVYDESGQMRFTCVINTQKERGDEKWIDVAREVYAVLRGREGSKEDEREEGREPTDISVEIIDRQRLGQRLQLESCTPQDAIYSQWNQVRSQIESLPTRGINTISCYCIGTESDPSNCVPTIVLGVNHAENRDWTAVREDIVEILTQHGLDTVGVLIRKDSVGLPDRWFDGPGLEKFVADGTSHIGQSLSSNRMPSKRGTLGGYVQLRNPTTGEWVPFALTCCRCVLPAGTGESETTKEQLVEKWRDSGVQVADEDAASVLLVDSPSQSEFIAKIKSLDSEIEMWKNLDIYKQVQAAEENEEVINPTSEIRYQRIQEAITRCRTERDDLERLFQQKSYILGPVFAAFGLVRKPLATILEKDLTASLSVVDWALIKIENRTPGTNKSRDLRLPLQDLSFLLHPYDYYKCSIPPGTRLMKLGHATGCTQGKYNALMVAHIATDPKTGKVTITHEHSILSSNTRQAIMTSGDAGALVYDIIGTVHGMCFGGNFIGDHAYFTHAADLMSDITRTVPGLPEIRLLGAEF